MRLCKCHGLEMVANGGGDYQCRVKRRASWREGQRRYRNTAKGRDQMHHDNQRRMFVGVEYVGRCGFTKAEREELIRGATD